jgi:cystathionine gamma-synthase
MVQAARSQTPDLHVLFPDDVYHGTRHLLLQLFAELGVACDAVDMTAPERVDAAMRPETRLLWVESPSNPLLKIADLQALAAIARAHGALCVVDNTWSSPVIQRPLELGADIVMYSTTKYFGGHSDVLGGALIVRDGLQTTVGERISTIQHLMGAVPSPFDCWLLLRSLATLPLRVRQQTANAAQIAAYLSTHPQIEQVFYPGLESHPQHAIARRQMQGGFGGMLSFCVRGGAEATSRVVNGVKLIQQATSLGGVESLMEHRRLSEGPDSTTPPNLIRFSVGIEAVEDLIADLAQALG